MLDTLGGVDVTDAERRSLEWLSGWEDHTVENIAALFAQGTPQAG